MKKFTKFCLIFALVLVLLAIVFGIAACSAGASRATIRTVRDLTSGSDRGILNLFHLLDDSDAITDSIADTEEETFEVTENMRELTVDVRNADVTIIPLSEYKKRTDADSIVVEKTLHKDLQTIDAVMENGVLTVKEIRDDSLNWLSLNDKRAKIKIYLPEGLAFQVFELEDDAGDVCLKSDLHVDNLTLNIGVGDTDVSGNIQVQQDASILSGTGDMNLENITCAGNLEIGNGVGDMEIRGTVVGNLNATCGTGDMEIYLKGDPDQYNYDITCGTGDVTINGEEYEGIGHDIKHETHHGAGTITLQGGIGDIDLEIKR